MKTKHLLLTVFAIFITGLSNFSSAQYSQWNFGFEGGPSATFTVGNDAVDLDTKPDFGFLVGLFGQYNFNQNYSLKLATNYQQKGSKLEISQPDLAGNDYVLDGKIKMYYITIPLLFRGAYGDYVKFFFNTGPYLGILLSNKTTIDANSQYNEPGREVDNTDSTKSTDFGITAGIGLQIPIATKSLLTFEIRDDIGLTNISDYTTDGSTKTNSLSLIVGLTFGAGKQYGVKKKTY